ncbi:MAG: hybrid sensor histidine kinase/response regulator [Candidatus Electryonea clarkiae]|nr:hybrid sensor histidine kinase/response regulator [Candidatus Electryonea clarkiae]MDP8287911.1 hybrid sensor histidine kinase/response regulator [Candidatus Electryonea clarkiae]
MKDLSESNILVVDDTEANIDILVESLGDKYELSVALDGETALEIVDESPPDLILLDIMMPEMDGYDVCAALKLNADTRDIPVIFLTAAVNIESKTKGFKLGAVDYITKPFEIREVEARVITHLSLKYAKEKLEAQHHELQNSYDALRVAENARDSLMHMIVHDMRTPLTGIKGSLDVFKILRKEHLDENEAKLLSSAQSGSAKLIEMVSSLLDLNRLESGQMPLDIIESDMVATIQEAIKIVGEPVNDVNLIFNPTEAVLPGKYDKDIVRRIVTNLMSNAIKFSEANDDINIDIRRDEDKIVFSIKDSGPGIPAELHEKIFEKFGQAEIKKEHRGYSSGIGLAFCKLAVEAHGGEIRVESEVGKGSCFIFNLPEAN